MTFDIFSTALGAFVSIVVVAIPTFGPIWQERWKLRQQEKKRTFAATLPQMHRVYAHLNEVVCRLGSKRAMVMYTENGGGKPNIGGQLYVSIVYEVYSYIGSSIRNQVQRMRVDECYVMMLGHMLANEEQRTIVKTVQMPNCMLRNLYMKLGTKMSLVYLIKETKARLYYASFNFPHDQLTAELLFECDIKANEIRQLFRDMK